MEKIRKSTIAIIGCGSLGCFAIQTLSAIGIGTLMVFDADKVERTNLARQILYKPDDIGKLKVDCVKNYVNKSNPDVNLIIFNTIINKLNIKQLIGKVDFIIDATDNFQTKFLINDYCISQNIPFVIAGVEKFDGQILSVVPKQTPCYRCIFGTIPQTDSNRSCSSVGVIATTPAFASNLQANEAIKSILGLKSGLKNHLFNFNLLEDIFLKIKINKDENCIACNGKGDFFLEQDYGDYKGSCF